MTHPTVDFISKISMFLFANIGHVSSANSVVLKLDTFGKPLTYSEKSRGDKIEPCGKPQLICYLGSTLIYYYRLFSPLQIIFKKL